MFSIPHTVKRVPLAHSTIGQRCHRRACPSEGRVSPPSSALQAENSCPIKRGTLSYVIWLKVIKTVH